MRTSGILLLHQGEMSEYCVLYSTDVPVSFSSFLRNRGQRREITARTMNRRAIGLLKKIEKLPFDRSRERRMLLSNMGPRIRERTIGAIGISK